MNCQKTITPKEQITNDVLRKNTPEPIKLSTEQKRSVMITVVDLLLKSGLDNMTLPIACGIAGNIDAESGFNYTSIGDNGSSYGLCQWHNKRWNNLYSYCQQINISPNTPEGQTQFIINELKTSFSSVYRTISSQDYRNDIDKVTTYFCKNFEIPANADTICPKRVVKAENVLTQYKASKGL